MLLLQPQYIFCFHEDNDQKSIPPECMISISNVLLVTCVYLDISYDKLQGKFKSIPKGQNSSLPLSPLRPNSFKWTVSLWKCTQFEYFRETEKKNPKNSFQGQKLILLSKPIFPAHAFHSCLCQIHMKIHDISLYIQLPLTAAFAGGNGVISPSVYFTNTARVFCMSIFIRCKLVVSQLCSLFFPASCYSKGSQINAIHLIEFQLNTIRFSPLILHAPLPTVTYIPFYFYIFNVPET